MRFPTVACRCSNSRAVLLQAKFCNQFLHNICQTNPHRHLSSGGHANMLFGCFPCKHAAYFNVLLSMWRRKATIYLSHAAAVVHKLSVSHNLHQNAPSVLISHVGRLNYDMFYIVKFIYSIQALYNYHFPHCVILGGMTRLPEVRRVLRDLFS